MFSNSVSNVMPSFKTALSENNIMGTALLGSGTITLPMTGVNNLTVSSGYVHVRSSLVNAATITAIKVTGTDGTSIIVLGQLPATAAGDAVDWVAPFVTDLKLKSITVAITLSGSTQSATFDVEAAGG